MAGARDVRAGKAYVELSTKDKMTRGLARAQARLQAFGAVCQRMGRSLFAVGGGVLAALGAATKVFADFEKQMAAVSTMLDRPVAHMARFKEAVRDMAVASGQSTETIAKGLYDILSAGVAPEKALGFLQAALRAAAGGMTDVATATKGMIRILRAYDMDASQAADISDSLFTVVKKGVITYQELADNVGTIAPSARAAGLTLQELSAAIATVVSVEEPARAMTALRQAIFEAAEEGTDLLSFVREFKDADLAKVIAAGIPKRAAQGVVILANNLKLLDENLAAMAGRAGAGEEAYKKMAGTLTKAFNQAKQAVVVAAGRIGEVLAPVLKDWLSGAKEAIESWAAWIRQNRELVAEYAKLALKIAAWTVGLGAALIVVGKLAFGVKGLIGVLAVLTAHPLVAAFVGVAAVIGGICYALDKLTVKVATLNDAASKHLRTQNEQRAADLARMDRLKQLADKQRLDNHEMDEATGIIDELGKRYGDLGVTLDRTTGRLHGVADAMGDVVKAMRAHAEFNIHDKIRELESNYADLQEQLETEQVWIWNVLSGRVDRDTARLNRLWDRIKAAKADLEAVRRGERGALTGGVEAEAAIPALPVPAGAAPVEEGPAWSREVMEERTGLRMEADAREAADEEARRRLEEQNRLRLAALDEEKRLRYEIARAEIEATKEGIDLRLALLALERRQALAQAPEGVDAALINRLYDARRQAILAGAEAQKVARRFEVRGQFGGLGAERIGGGNTAERMASGIEEIVKNTKPLRQAGTLVFG